MREKVRVSKVFIKVLIPRLASMESVVRPGNLNFDPHSPNPQVSALGWAPLVLSDIVFSLPSGILHKLFSLLGTLSI